MEKISSDFKVSFHVLDLSRGARVGRSAAYSLPGEPETSLSYSKTSHKRRFFSFKKLVLFLLLAAVLNASLYGWGVWNNLSNLKATALSANAMSEENIASIEKLIGIIQYLPAVGEAKKIKELALDFESFKSILGFDRPKKYLMVFQNPAEARATGGFIGSVGVLEIYSGKIKSLKLQDVYGLDGQLKDLVEPPSPIKKISAAWSLHDSNWFFDFPRSSETISWFYEKGGGETMDGVVAFNPKVVEDILRVAGPVKMDDYGAELNEKNFVDIAQNEVELEYDKTINRPKMFLADLMAQLKENVDALPLDKKIVIMKNLIVNLDQKDIQAVFRDQSAQDFIHSHNWDGQVRETDGDYLAAVHSNINGFKSDAVVDEKISLVTEISEDGEIINNLTVERINNGAPEDNEWYNKVNSDYFRIFAPRGSELLAAEGATKEKPFLKDPLTDYSRYLKNDAVKQAEESKSFDEEKSVEIFSESNKTVFGSWIYVSPGEKNMASWRYRLPFKMSFDSEKHTGVYSLLFQKQSGSRAKNITQTIVFPKNWRVLGNYAGDFSIQEGKIERVINAEGDRYLPVLFLKND